MIYEVYYGDAYIDIILDGEQAKDPTNHFW